MDFQKRMTLRVMANTPGPLLRYSINRWQNTSSLQHYGAILVYRYITINCYQLAYSQSAFTRATGRLQLRSQAKRNFLSPTVKFPP
jgi:hypothetical protein